MRKLFHPETNDIRLTTVLDALSDQIRIQIVREIAKIGEQSCGNVNIPIPKSTLSHHYKVLRESGITYTRVEGTQRFNSLRTDDLNKRFPGLLDAILQAAEPI
ncbi:ArsR/SmtB family transcription factor (plasmid) [Bacillus toyonensis]|uniref:ArsR/SmtB family transcription factor n=1 Tax=Bacillus cereus group TaxID=86661 RepID=UPI000330CA15|nr:MULTISPECIES: helix-turn-helix transcriptional regulator [Bacillus cereus group]MDA2626904.1 helix-turn-helix transcriptional regulator [Bacillus cereus]EOO24328.1 ArsR family transcriptional regulator [Bacillus cereus BAG1X1-1]EOO44997.1 ArsR family transcriptional regulator [Bacillus cereus BAG1X2-2]EOO62748.1 ArsR family transcriptional regulator [Bacillus cereus BAG1X2-3]EOP00623.1 ArsR family transcriptional regulator [Bacillus cereus BAG2O-1]